MSKSMTDTTCSKITCAVEREQKAEQWTPSLLPITCPPAISFSCYFPLVSATEVPAAHCGGNCLHSESLETSLTFWESKGKQTLRTQTKILDRRRAV